MTYIPPDCSKLFRSHHTPLFRHPTSGNNGLSSAGFNFYEFLFSRPSSLTCKVARIVSILPPHPPIDLLSSLEDFQKEYFVHGLLRACESVGVLRPFFFFLFEETLNFRRGNPRSSLHHFLSFRVHPSVWRPPSLFFFSSHPGAMFFLFRLPGNEPKKRREKARVVICRNFICCPRAPPSKYLSYPIKISVARSFSSRALPFLLFSLPRAPLVIRRFFISPRLAICFFLQFLLA